MKKLFLIIIAVVMCCVAMNAAQLTSAQQKAKVEIYKALRNIGTNLKDESEESISFQNNGTRYNVSIQTLNSQTLYLCLSVLFGLPEEYNSEIANIAAFKAASGKPVCSFSMYGALVFSCEMYTKDAKPFIAVLPEMLTALTTSVEKFPDEYEKAEQEYTPSTTKSFATSFEASSNEYIFPQVSSDSDSGRLYVEKVSLTPEYTILDMISYNGRMASFCGINPNSFIKANGKQYKLIKTDRIAIIPEQTYYPNYQSGNDVSLSFRLYFPRLPKDITVFDFMEETDHIQKTNSKDEVWFNNGWYVKGIKLDNSGFLKIQGESVASQSHVWSCEAIQLQDRQTVLLKKGTPKSARTYMYSSQDEYIEDADTGRKYYLTKSSIGFEANPHNTYDLNPVDFAEVYPALPSTVKRINISSGSQYFVKGLKIR